MAPHSSTLAWKIPWRSLAGCSPWGLKESDTTEQLHFHFSLSHIGEGNGNPLQCSCLENPRDGGAWWAAVYGVAESRTRPKWLSSSNRINRQNVCLFIPCSQKWKSPASVTFNIYLLIDNIFTWVQTPKGTKVGAGKILCSPLPATTQLLSPLV